MTADVSMTIDPSLSLDWLSAEIERLRRMCGEAAASPKAGFVVKQILAMLPILCALQYLLLFK